jgi:hypothetical protein
MSTDVTMQELELETAELLPARETLGMHSGPSGHGSGISQFGSNFGFGNANQQAVGGSGNGGLLSALNGDAVNVNIL